MDENMDSLNVSRKPGTEIVKWLTYLLYAKLAGMVISVVNTIPAVALIAGWAARAVTVAVIVILFQMTAASKNYRNAALCQCAVLIGGMIGQSFLNLIISICSIIAVYQEYTGHSELTAPLDYGISGRWHSLFYWQMGIGLLSGFLSSAGVVIGVMANMDSDKLVYVILLISTVISMIIEVVYLLLMKKTIALFQK